MEYYVKVGDTDFFAQISPKQFKNLNKTMEANNSEILVETTKLGKLNGTQSTEKVVLIRGAKAKEATA